MKETYIDTYNCSYSNEQFINSSIQHSQHVHAIPSSNYNARNTIAKINIDKNTYLEKKLSRNQLCHCNVPPNHRPVRSSISQQHCHPRAGHDSHKESGNCNMLTHSQRHIKIQPRKNYIWVYQATKEVEGWIAKIVSSTTELWTHAPDRDWILKHLHTQHKEAPPSLLHRPSVYAFPFSALQDVQETITNPSWSLCVVPFYNRFVKLVPPSSTPNQFTPKNRMHSQQDASSRFEEKNILHPKMGW